MTNPHQINHLTVSAPGRICLFGEHQDYLGLPVIPAAIDLRLTITGEPRADKIFNIQLPDINSQDEFSIEAEVPYQLERDYLRSGFNVLSRKGVKFDYGYNCKVQSTIPIKAGTASSSALCVAWIKFLLCLAGEARQSDPYQIAYLAYLSEVKEFNEPGGMMDHFSSALGSVIYVDFVPFGGAVRLSLTEALTTKPEFRIPKRDSSKEKSRRGITQLTNKLGTFVLGDSLQQKDTKKTLSRIKTGVLNAVEKIKQIKQIRISQGLLRDLYETNLGLLKVSSKSLSELTPYERKLLEGVLTIHKITKQAKALFISGKMDDHKMGELLNAHQAVLREKLNVSTNKIDRMLEESIKAGGLGGKINGSGEGGCMFVYAPTKAEEVAAAIVKTGGRPYIINLADGARRE